MAGAFVYIAARGKAGRLYTGVSAEPALFHGDGLKLYWVEACRTLPQAMQRGRSIRGWKRSCKIAVIERANPGWKDLAAGL